MENKNTLSDVTLDLLGLVSDLHGVPAGAYNIREDSGCAGRNSTENIQIVSKTDRSGIDIIVKPGTKGETVYIPAIITHGGVHDLVYNDFIIGEGADVTIVAGCGVHNSGCEASEHNGIHSFALAKGSHVVYLEKHIGIGEGTGERVINPQTFAVLQEDSCLEMETTQIKGVDSTKRFTKCRLDNGAKVIIHEKIMTHGKQTAETSFEVDMNGENSSVELVSRSVARNDSRQLFLSKINGNNKCAGHSECDAIIMDHGVVSAIPEITANSVDAALIHEAVIGKIAGEQLTKLMTLGLTEEEAETKIIEGFLS